MSCWTKEQLENMLEDVVNVLDLSEGAIAKHGPVGTAPAELVKLALEEKDMKINALNAGFKDALFDFATQQVVDKGEIENAVRRAIVWARFYVQDKDLYDKHADIILGIQFVRNATFP